MNKNIMRVVSLLLILILLCVNVSAKDVVKEYDDANLNEVYNTVNGNSKLPVEINAKSAVLMDFETGEIILNVNGDKKLYPASVTKIMTILLVCESIENKKISLDDKVVCSSNAASKGGSQIWLKEGEVMTVDELLRATVIGSANDAATLLGEYISGSEKSFIDLMNKRAKELGMKNTNFVNATGLDDDTNEHLTTAEDIALMSRELLKHKFIYKYTTTWMDQLRNGKTELVNTNKLVRFYEGTTGLKTGTTSKAGCCLSASAKRDDLHLIAVVMGSNNSKDRFNTAKALLNWGFSNYCCVKPKLNKNSFKPITVIGGKEEKVKIIMPKIKPILLKKGEEEKVSVDVKISKEVEAPVEKNQTVGTVTVKVNNNKINEYKILTKNQVERLSFFDCFLIICNYLCSGNTNYPVKT